jgi:cobalt-zinc-cadmium efflux system outer membrane protein
MAYIIICFALLSGLLAHGPAIGEALTLKQVLKKTMDQNPQLKASASETKAKKAQIDQSGLLPNPELEMEVENFGKNEMNIVLSQVIELGGKRASRIALAEKERDITRIEQEIAELETLTETNNRFLDLLAIQLKMALMDKSVVLAQNILSSVEARVNAGASTRAEALRAKTALSMTKIQKDEMGTQFFAGKCALSGMWGGEPGEIDSVMGDLKISVAIPELSLLMKHIEKNPELEKYHLELSRQKQQVKKEEKQRIPDLTLGGGYKRDNESKSNMAVISLAIDLPLFNRNQGNIRSSHLGTEIADFQMQDAENRIKSVLFRLYFNLKFLDSRIKMLEDNIIANVDSAFIETQRLFNAGKAGYLDLADAQKDLIEMNVSLIESRTAFLQHKAEIERYIGISFEQLN